MVITLDQVRYFVAVAEELHFGRAADRLQMTQPPLSRQIQKLERAVGAQLLERDNRRVALTAAGVAFLEDCYRLLNTMDGAVAHARRVEGGSAGTLHLGFTAVSAIGLLGPLLRLLDAELPDVEVTLHERVTGRRSTGSDVARSTSGSRDLPSTPACFPHVSWHANHCWPSCRTTIRWRQRAGRWARRSSTTWP